MILITGATGQVGKELVKGLLEHKVPFRAVAHSQSSAESLKAQGIETVRADLSQPKELQTALAGVERVFLLTPSSLVQAQIENGIIDAARQAGVQHVVKLSVLDADTDDPRQTLFKAHAQVEDYLKSSGLAYTILRPNAFMQNFDRVNASTIKGQGAIYVSAGDGQISFVDTRDIAAVALAALTSSEHAGKTYDLTGPQSLAYHEVAQKFTAHLGKPVQYVPLDDEAMRQGMLGGGVPAWYADGLVELYRFYREGKGATVADGVSRATGQPARTLDAYITNHLGLFQN